MRTEGPVGITRDLLLEGEFRVFSCGVVTQKRIPFIDNSCWVRAAGRFFPGLCGWSVFLPVMEKAGSGEIVDVAMKAEGIFQHI